LSRGGDDLSIIKHYVMERQGSTMKITDVIVAVCGTIVKIALIIVMVVAIYRGASLAYNYGYRIFEEAPVSSGEGYTITVKITENMSAKEMGKMLADKGLIRDEKLFVLQYMFSEFKDDLLPGEHDLSTAMTVEEMMEEMTKEKVAETGDEEVA